MATKPLSLIDKFCGQFAGLQAHRQTNQCQTDANQPQGAVDSVATVTLPLTGACHPAVATRLVDGGERLSR